MIYPVNNVIHLWNNRTCRDNVIHLWNNRACRLAAHGPGWVGPLPHHGVQLLQSGVACTTLVGSAYPLILSLSPGVACPTLVGWSIKCGVCCCNPYYHCFCRMCSFHPYFIPKEHPRSTILVPFTSKQFLVFLPKNRRNLLLKISHRVAFKCLTT